jgi:hypothetical protein
MPLNRAFGVRDCVDTALGRRPSHILVAKLMNARSVTVLVTLTSRPAERCSAGARCP